MGARGIVGRGLGAVALSLWLLSGAAAASPTDTEVEARADALLAKLTLEEKVALMAGGSAFGTAAIPRLGIPALVLSDGPNGVRSGDEVPATVFPTGSALGATWDTAVVQAVGSAIGREARALGVQVMLGPNVNIQRSPLGGRNFEMYSEDPLLSGRLGAAFVTGVQGEGVGTSVKHFVGNEQELHRLTSSSNVGERALREIYLRPFELIVREAHPWTVMASYNRLNGAYMTENSLIRQVLKGEWGFEGLLMSDWGAVHTTASAASAGTDLEMPGPPKEFGAPLLAAAQAGQVPQAVIDEAARRMLRTVVRSGVMDGSRHPAGELRSARNHDAALAAARESITLLRNEGGLLPLSAAGLHTLAVIGPDADVPLYEGGGSASVVPGVISTPLAQLQAIAPAVRIVYSRGVDNDEVPPPIDPRLLSPTAERRQQGLSYHYFDNADFKGRPVRQGTATYFDATMIAGHLAQLSARLDGYLWPQQTGTYQLSLSQIGAGHLYIDDQEVIGPHTGTELPPQLDFGPTVRVGSIRLEAGRGYRLRVEYVSAPPFHSLHVGLRVPVDGIGAAVALARSADAAVVFVGSSRSTETEGRDRAAMALPGAQDELVQAVLRANPRTVVVVEGGAPYALPWSGQAPAILQAWLDGEAGPQAMAEVLFGAVNPSGKLPTSFPKRLADTPAYLYYDSGPDADYGEGVFVGYRYYDTKGIEPAFPFGHGLSYTTFAYRNLVVPGRVGQGGKVEVSVDIANTGVRDGAEIVQLYVGDEATHAVVSPEKELRAFRRVSLRPGESQTVRFSLTPRDFEYYDAHAHGWASTPGLHRISVGASSRDVRVSQQVELVAGL
jgi:beta-glucosidase